MADRTLPAGWTGNDASHHTERGAWRVEVYRTPGLCYRWQIRLGYGVLRDDALGYAHADPARRAAWAREAAKSDPEMARVLDALRPR